MPAEGHGRREKRKGERTELSPQAAERWKKVVTGALDTLDAALNKSSLPDEPPNFGEVDAWLMTLRRGRLR